MTTRSTAQGSAASKSGRPFWSRSGKFLPVGDYHVGPLDSDVPVRILASGAVAGDISAPAVAVEGLVLGDIMAVRVAIETNGQVWGDIYTVELTLETDGQLQGWVYTVDEAAFSTRPPRIERKKVGAGVTPAAEERGSAETPAASPLLATIPPALQEAWETHVAAGDGRRTALLRWLVDEAGAAVLARLELEAHMEKRIAEIADSRITRAEREMEAAAALQQERDHLLRQLHELRAQLQAAREEQLQADVEQARLKEALSESRSEADSRSQLIDELGEVRDALAADKEALAVRLSDSQESADALANRVRGLESALESSLQRNSELEEALMRWQELAENNEAALLAARQTLQNTDLHKKEADTVLANLRRQNQELAARLERVEEERAGLLEQLASREEEEPLQEKLEKIQEELARRSKELDLSKQALVESTAAYTQLKQEAGRAEERLAAAEAELDRLRSAEEKGKQLEAKLADLEERYPQAAAALAEWDERTADFQRQEQAKSKIQEELLVVRDSLAAQAETVSQLQETNTRQSAELRKAREIQQTLSGERDELQERLSEVKQTLSSLQTELGAIKKQSAQRGEQLAVRINNHEKDLEKLIRELEKQGKKLATTQAALVDKEVAYRQLKDQFEQRSAELSTFRQGAAHHIRQLKGELAAREKELRALRPPDQKNRDQDERP